MGVGDIMTENEDALSFAQRVQAFRRDMAQADWADDKILSLGGTKGYPYLSTDKAKRNMAPLLVKHGLEVSMDFEDMQILPAAGSMTQHFVVKLRATLFDPATGKSIRSSVYGEAGDPGDKGLVKAQTAAVKQWIVQTYMIADGIDPMVMGNSPMAAFYSKTPEEQEEVKSKVLEKSIKPTPKAEPAKEEPKEEPEEAPKEEPAEEEAPKEKEPAKKEKATKKSKKEEDVEPPAEPEGPAEAPAEPAEVPNAPHCEYEFKKPHKLAINNIINSWTEKAKGGEVTVDSYNEMSMAYATIASDADAIAFIKKYRV